MRKLAFLILFASGFLCAKEMPPKSTGVFAANAKAVVGQASDALHLPVSARHANRISVKDGRIERFICDPALLEVRHDAQSGSLYVIPLTKEDTPLYVVSESGETHSLMLSPKDKIASRNLEIRETAKKEAPLPDLEGMPAEAAVQEIIRSIPVLKKTPAQALSSTREVSGFKVRDKRRWESGSFLITESFATSSYSRSLSESLFWKPGVVAVAAESDSAIAGVPVRIWTVSRGRSA